MKIISINNYDEWKEICSCNSCLLKFEIGAKDVKRKTVSKWCGSYDFGHSVSVNEYYINCSKCNQECYIKSKYIPLMLKNDS